MDIMGRFRNSTAITRPSEIEIFDTDETFAVVETDEHEQVVFSGASDAEVDAKLHDFMAWAS